jgi:hypothetical protein
MKAVGALKKGGTAICALVSIRPKFNALDALLVGRDCALRSSPIGMSSTHTYIVPLAMLAIGLMLIAAALWL